MKVVTIKERQARWTAEKRAAVEALREELSAAARRIGGRYLLFGSAARGELRWDSDVDLLLDFPDEARTTAAWQAAEEACWKRDLGFDIMPLSWCKPDFRAHVLPEAVVIA